MAQGVVRDYAIPAAGGSFFMWREGIEPGVSEIYYRIVYNHNHEKGGRIMLHSLPLQLFIVGTGLLFVMFGLVYVLMFILS